MWLPGDEDWDDPSRLRRDPMIDGLRQTSPDRIAELVVYKELGWWSGIRLEFVMNHTLPPWMIPDDERRCPVPESCDRHYDHVQGYVWRIGKVLGLYQLIDESMRRRDFPALEPRYAEFSGALAATAHSQSERRLPDELLPAWWEAFGGNQPMGGE